MTNLGDFVSAGVRARSVGARACMTGRVARHRRAVQLKRLGIRTDASQVTHAKGNGLAAPPDTCDGNAGMDPDGVHQ